MRTADCSSNFPRASPTLGLSTIRSSGSRSLGGRTLIGTSEVGDEIVDEWRDQLDPLAPLGVPPHITVLFPFVKTTELASATIDTLHRLAASAPSFQFRLTRIGWFEPRVLWLGPDPASPFLELTALVSKAFPECPPYGGQFTDLVPHLTVADTDASAQLAVAAKSLLPALPINATAHAITLVIEAPDRSWREHSRFPLASN